MEGYTISISGQKSRFADVAGQPLEQLLKAGHYRGEILPVRLLRGVLGTILLGGIAVYTLHAVVFKPIWETTHLPTKELRISTNDRVGLPNVSLDFNLGQPVWNIIPYTYGYNPARGTNSYDFFISKNEMLDCIQVVPLGNQGMSFQP